MIVSCSYTAERFRRYEIRELLTIDAKITNQ